MGYTQNAPLWSTENAFTSYHKIQGILVKKSTLQAVLPMGKGNQDLGHFFGSATRSCNIYYINRYMEYTN